MGPKIIVRKEVEVAEEFTFCKNINPNLTTFVCFFFGGRGVKGGVGTTEAEGRERRSVVKKINSRHSQNIFKNTSSHVRSEEKSGKMLPDKMKGRSWDTDIACRDTYSDEH